MKSPLRTSMLRSIAMLLVSFIGTSCTFGGLIVVDLASPIEATVSSAPADQETPIPQDPGLEQPQSFAVEPPTSPLSSSAISACLPLSSNFLFDDEFSAQWFRNMGIVHGKVIPYELLRPP